MKDFFFVLEQQVEASGSLLCVGLDPHSEELEQNNAAGVKSFCRRLVKDTAPYAAAFKPNAAFFESHGSEGWDVLKEIIELIKEESDTTGPCDPDHTGCQTRRYCVHRRSLCPFCFCSIGSRCHHFEPIPWKGFNRSISFLPRKRCLSAMQNQQQGCRRSAGSKIGWKE